MKLKAINCKNMGSILVHQQKPDGAPTDLVAEVHSGFDDARYIAECVNAAASQDENTEIFCVKYPALQFALNAPSAEIAEIRRLLEQEKMKMVLETWPEDVADHPVDPTIIQGGVVVKQLEEAGRIPELMKEQLKHFTTMSTHHRDCRLSTIESLAQVEAERDELLETLEYCRSVFDGYVSLHLDKSPPDYDKAASNETHRAVCDAAIASVKGGAE